MPGRSKVKRKFRGLDFKAKKKKDEDKDFVPDTQPVMVLEAEQEIDTTGIREKTLAIKDNINKYYTELCENLWLIQKKQLFKSWGYPSFREYGSKELDFGGTKAIYLASIWNNLAVNQDKSVFDEVMELGWSKGKELARVVNKENIKEWVGKAKNMRVETLVKEIRTYIKKKVPDNTKDALDREADLVGSPVADESKTISLTFQHSDDYLTFCETVEKMKEEDPNISLSGVVVNACREFLGGGGMSKERALQTIFTLAKSYGLEVTVTENKFADTDEVELKETESKEVEKLTEDFNSEVSESSDSRSLEESLFK
jgi:hypothetical protein